MKVLVDTKCHDLAEAFLEDMEVNDEAQMQRMVAELASVIQVAIEDQINEWNDHPERKPVAK
jgi:5'-deoxynucleotidase YfbR-like HD superfamily hydrolase